tara:strand:- start:42 stop:377 length:336 start_codon:yes stop_codon:yes gene_type:complete
MIKESHLIKIKTLTKSHAKQLTVIEYDNRNDDTLFRRIALGSHPERGDARLTEVHGWINGETLTDIGCKGVSRMKQFWLVKHRGQFYWFPAPTKGEPYDYYMNGRLEQLFV